MADDYFTKLHKRSQPVRDAFNKPKSPSPASTPGPAKSAAKPVAKAGELQGESLEDWTYMRRAVDKIGKKLAPKSIMGKSSSKR